MLTQLTRHSVHTVLGAARLPLGALQLVAGRSRDRTWPPVLAFDSFEGGVKQVLGSVLSDEILVEEGRLERTRVAELREAVRLEDQADLLRQQAEVSFEERMHADDDRRREAEAQAERERRAAEQAKVRAEQREAEQAEEARQAAQKAAARRKAELEKQERTARLAGIGDERAALEGEQRATRASAAVAKADHEIQASKKARAAKKPSPARGTNGRTAPRRRSVRPNVQPRDLT